MSAYGHLRRYDDWGRLKKKFRSGKSAEDRKAREQAALARLHGTVRFRSFVRVGCRYANTGLGAACVNSEHACCCIRHLAHSQPQRCVLRSAYMARTLDANVGFLRSRRRLLQGARSWKRAPSQMISAHPARLMAAIDGRPTVMAAAGTAAGTATGAASAIVIVIGSGSALGTANETGIEMGDQVSGTTAGTVTEIVRGTTGDMRTERAEGRTNSGMPAAMVATLRGDGTTSKLRGLAV